MSDYYKFLKSNRTTCLCGGFYKYYNYSIHIKTKKHINYLNKNIENITFILNID